MCAQDGLEMGSSILMIEHADGYLLLSKHVYDADIALQANYECAELWINLAALKMHICQFRQSAGMGAISQAATSILPCERAYASTSWKAWMLIQMLMQVPRGLAASQNGLFGSGTAV